MGDKAAWQDALKKLSYMFKGYAPIMLSIIIALSGGLIDLIPGYILASVFEVFYAHPWLLLLYPQLLSIRGSIGGIFSGRMTTNLHLGVIKASFRDDTPEFYSLLLLVSLLYLLTGLVISLLSSLIIILILNYGFTLIPGIFLIVYSTFFLTQITMIPLVVFIARSTYIHGWDPDILTYPLSSSIGDLVITTFFILNSFILLIFDGSTMLIILSLMNIPLLLILTSFRVSFRIIFRWLGECILAIFIASLIVNVTGNFLRALIDKLSIYKSIYFIYPSILTTVGSSGSIIGSISSTRLVLYGGIGGDRRIYIVMIYLPLTISILFLGYLGLGDIALGLYTPIEIYLSIFTLGLSSPLMITIISILVSYVSFMRGLDPDNFIIPITTTIADALTTILLYIILMAI